MITCKDCRYFTPPESYDYPEWKMAFGSCQLAETEDDELTHTTSAFAEDAERYHARLRVKPSFGCNQGKKK